MTGHIQMELDIESLQYVKHVVSMYQAADAIETLQSAIEKESFSGRRMSLMVNIAFLKLSLELTSDVINICGQVLKQEPSFTMAHFLKGLAFLWKSHEEAAISAWEDALKVGGPARFYALMKRLTVDPNVRAHLFQLRYDVEAVVDMLQDSVYKVYTESDTQQAFAELRGSMAGPAISHFNLILAADPANYEAYKGRACGHCLLGNWMQAIEDFTKAIEADVDVDECCKYRGMAYAALGKYGAAVMDLSHAISLSPRDYDAILVRARIQMRRKLYGHALRDFEKVSDSRGDDNLWLSIAECRYALGYLATASEALARVSGDDPRKLYCHFLILRDTRKFEEALEVILKLVETLPVFFTLRTAADFLSDLGRSEEAIRYYKLALDQKPGDADTQRLYGLALFESGEAMQAVTLLQQVSETADLEERTIAYSELVINDILTGGDVENFDKKTTEKSLLKECSKDGRFMLFVMKSSYLPISECLRELARGHALIKKTEIPESFSLPEATDVFDKLLEDADRLGRKCVPEAKEVVDNRRVIRALGLCVLYIARQMKTKYFLEPEDSDWEPVLEECKGILNLADMRQRVKWVAGHSSMSTAGSLPIYYLQRGERCSPRFCQAKQMQLAVSKLREEIRNHNSKGWSGAEIDALSDLPAIYAMAQKDLKVTQTLPVGGGDQIFSMPLHLQYLGDHGWNLFLQPHQDVTSRSLYYKVLSDMWLKVVSNDGQSLAALASFVVVFWITHPLACYSPEFGHVFFHAYLLASDNAETGVLEDGPGELFMRYLLRWNATEMLSICRNLYEKRTPSTVHQESLDFWNELPSFGTVLKLLQHPYTKPEPQAKSE